MGNLKYSYMTNMWGLMVRYPVANQWGEWYEGDFGNSVYYLDWDRILRYHVGAGFKGIEQVTGMFSLAFGSEERANHPAVLAMNWKMIDFTSELGGENINIMPASGYFGHGPLTKEQLRNSAGCFNEIARYAVDKGVVACIHGEFWCAFNKYDIERFIEMTDPKDASFVFDTAQDSIIGFDPFAMYDKHHECIQYFHLKDTNLAPIYS